MTTVREQGHLIYRSQASKAPIGPSSNDRDHEDSFEPNKPGPFEAPIRPETPAGPKALSRLPQAPPPTLL